MSIGKRVDEAFAHLVAHDPSEALFDICAAIEETARREAGKGGRAEYKAFIERSLPIITRVGLPAALAGLRFGWSHPDITSAPDGTVSFADVVYHVVRCGLYHRAGVTQTVVFTENRIGSNAAGQLLLPRMLVGGLILAVVASPANSHESANPAYFFEVKGDRLVLNDLWGRRSDLLSRLGGISPAASPTV